jgi:hypothetical protein
LTRYAKGVKIKMNYKVRKGNEMEIREITRRVLESRVRRNIIEVMNTVNATLLEVRDIRTGVHYYARIIN